MKLPIARFLNHICHDVNLIDIPIQIKTSAMHLDHVCCTSIGILVNLICCKLKKKHEFIHCDINNMALKVQIYSKEPMGL